MEHYEYERYIADADNLSDKIEQYGIAIIPSILNEVECAAMINGMWDYLEHVTNRLPIPMNRDNSDTWREFSNLYPLHSMLLQRYGVGHTQFVWDLRTNPKIVDIFAQFWECDRDELLVSFDGASFHFPPEITKKGWYRHNDWLHTDQSYTKEGFTCLQSWVTALPVNNGDATLTFLENSHTFHAEFKEHFNITDKSDWYKINDNQYQFYIDRGCTRKSIRCPAGSLVLWDSRTIHMGQEAMKGRANSNQRCVVYLCYSPRKSATNANLRKKISCFENLRMTNHIPHKPKMFAEKPRTYGAQLPDIPPINAPVINDLGRKLVGY